MKACCEAWLTEQFGDDRETIEAVYAEYLETMAELAGQLTEVRRSGDAAALDRVLHTIKGSAAMAGDQELADLAQESRSPGSAERIDRLERELAGLERP